MIIDCEGCVLRDRACGDCVVSVLLGPPPEQIGSEEQVALAVLADGGLVPPLRMLPVRGDTGDAAGAGRVGPGQAGPGPGPVGPGPRRRGQRGVASA